MNRESFVPPSAGASRPSGVRYLCASCASQVTLTKGEPVRCKECGHRVLYKERSRRVIQFEAR